MIDFLRGRGLYAYWTKAQRVVAGCAFTVALSAALWGTTLIK